MKLTRLMMVPAVLSLAFAAGCASDPNKEVKSADTELTSEQQKANQDQRELADKQAAERAKNPPKTRDDAAEMNAKHNEQQHETLANGQSNVSSAEKNVANANENMAQDRRDFETKAKERLGKLDAKAQEMKTKSAKLVPAKKTTFNTNFTKYSTDRASANTKIQNLPTIANDNWQSAKKDLENSLDTLETQVDKLEKDL